MIQSTVGGPFVEQLGNPYTTGSTPADGAGSGLAKFKGNFGVEWTRGRLSAGWLARYVGPYNEGAEYGVGGAAFYKVNTIDGWVSGQIYHDAYVAYKVGKAKRTEDWFSRALANTSVQIGVKNLFAHVPPYDAVGAPNILWFSPYGDVQLRDYWVSVKKAW